MQESLNLATAEIAQQFHDVATIKGNRNPCIVSELRIW